METNNHQIVDYDLVLDEKFGKIGTPERAKSEEKARAYYASQILSEARRESGMTQNELARRVHRSLRLRMALSSRAWGCFTASSGNWGCASISSGRCNIVLTFFISKIETSWKINLYCRVVCAQSIPRL